MSLVLGLSSLIVVGALTETREARADQSHVVSWGESLWSIAQQYGLSVDAIADANGISDHNYVRAGQELAIPGGGSGGGTSATADWHRVQPGESLSQIALQYGTSVSAMVEANLLSDPNYIYAGQQLMLPGGYTTAAGGGGQGGSTPANPRLSHAEAQQLIAAAEREFGIPPGLLQGLAWQESGFQSWVVSSAGAIGLTQVMPETGEWVVNTLLPGADDWATNPRNNARVGAAFLRYLLDITGGDTNLALAGYYQGLGNVRMYGWFADTISYVDNVLYFQGRYQ